MTSNFQGIGNFLIRKVQK